MEAAGNEVWTLSRRRTHERALEVDITDIGSVRRGVPVKSIDAIVHLAAHIPQPENTPDLLNCQAANFNSTLNLLEFARDSGIMRFVYISSLSMFDESRDETIHEDTVPSPTTDYSISKLAGEYLCRYYQSSCGMEVPVLRLGTIYGPGMSRSRMIHYFVERCVKHEPFSVYKSNVQINVAHLMDAVNAITAMLSAKPRTYHLATESFSKRGLVLAIRKATNSRSAVTFDSDQPVALRRFAIGEMKSIMPSSTGPFAAFEDRIREYAAAIFE